MPGVFAFGAGRRCRFGGNAASRALRRDASVTPSLCARSQAIQHYRPELDHFVVSSAAMAANQPKTRQRCRAFCLSAVSCIAFHRNVITELLRSAGVTRSARRRPVVILVLLFATALDVNARDKREHDDGTENRVTMATRARGSDSTIVSTSLKIVPDIASETEQSTLA